MGCRRAGQRRAWCGQSWPRRPPVARVGPCIRALMVTNSPVSGRPHVASRLRLVTHSVRVSEETRPRMQREKTMTIMEPFFREAGTGPGVVCLHANASTSGQWRGLMDTLAPRFRVFAPDSYDCGKSPQWPSDRVIRLRDEVTLIDPVLTRAGSPLALVGHSFGATVALIAALANPGRVRAMALYEPTLFSLLDAETPPPNAAEGIREVVVDAGVALCRRESGRCCRTIHRLLDGNRKLGADSRAAQAAHCRVGEERAEVGLCPVHRTHTAEGIPLTRCSRALHGGQAVDTIGSRGWHGCW
jgi:dienelactone hydrolase